MMRAMALLFLLLLALGIAGCGDDASSAALEGDVRYVRSGGIAGDIDELVVRPDGSATLKSRRGGDRSFDLTESELDALAQDMQGFRQGPKWGRSPRPAPDAYVHVVEYEGHKRTTDDAADHGTNGIVQRLQQIIDAHG